MAARKSQRRSPRQRAATGSATDPQLVKMAELSRRSGTPGPTIKHYIREGLLPGPAIRTSRNMAYYDARLVGRIRVIKELQAERFLPLRVIGELLEAAPSDRLRADREPSLRKRPAVVGDEPARAQRRKRSEVMRTIGLSRAELDSLERAGVLELRGDGDTAGYGGADLELLEIIAEVRRRGLTEVFPISVAEPYLAAVKRLVQFEVAMFRRRARAADSAVPLPEIARHAVELGERLIVGLRAKLLPGLSGRVPVR
jgi:DNA-binding transcriptional MerR regulator